MFLVQAQGHRYILHIGREVSCGQAAGLGGGAWREWARRVLGGAGSLSRARDRRGRRPS